MSGTTAGGKKAAATNREKHGKDFYANIGRKGGKAGHTGGFCSMTHEQRVAYGRIGGAKSRRGPAKRTMENLNLEDYPPSLREKVKRNLGIMEKHLFEEENDINQKR